MRPAIKFLWLLAVSALAIGRAPAAPKIDDFRPFLDQHCLACHNESTKTAGLDFAKLPLTAEDPSAFATWVRVHDRVRDHEMPPEALPQPAAEQRASFVRSLDEALRRLDEDRQEAEGRVNGRRLNRIEYENSVHSLLSIDVPLIDYLPDESRRGVFDTLAQSQQMSHFLLEKYLRAADAALDVAFARALTPEPDFSKTFALEELGKPGGGNNRRPRMRPDKGDIVTWSTSLVYVGRMPVTTVEQEGWYKIRVSASAVNPDEYGRVWASLRNGVCYARAPVMYWIGLLELTEEPRDFEFVAWMEKDQMLELRPADHTRPRPGYNKIKEQGNEVTEQEGVPGAAIHALEMERVFPGGTQSDVRRALFGDLTVEPSADGRARVMSDDPRADAARLMRSFAARAFRRPASDADVAPYLALVDRALEAGEPFEEALRAGYRGLLCSPRFLYLPEEPGRLDDYALASRLSYFLWSAPPDQELLDLAERDQLGRRETLHVQVERMLAAPKARAFTQNFTAQWLDLREIDFTRPDRVLYPEFDESLKSSMLAETRMFFDELLQEDLSVSNFVDSDFTFLNARLAKHYGVPDVEGLGMRKARLPEDLPRGGVMTQGSVLKVTANGTTTSPVVRGAWVTERILGRPVPPPPANVAAVEPDIRGAKTIREQLALHRDNAACASCHVKIDPPGFALESFDPIGLYRASYRALTEDGKKWRDGPAVDPSYSLADGVTFENIEQFKSLLLEDREEIARNIAEKLLVYGTGAEISFADRAAVDAIVEKTAENDYGLRSILHAVVESPRFLNK